MVSSWCDFSGRGKILPGQNHSIYDFAGHDFAGLGSFWFLRADRRPAGVRGRATTRNG